MNIVVIKGNLTRDPEARQVGSGDKKTQVANFTIAVNRHFTRANGEKDKETTYVDCEVWDSAASYMAENCKKGDPLLVQGALKLDAWESPEGEKRSRLKVRVNNFDRLYRSPNPGPNSAQQNETADTSNTEETVGAGSGEDIPF